MANFPMIGNYSATKLNSTQFTITFQYPENCYFEISTVNNSYVVKIYLNPGESTPSTTYKNHNFNANIINNVMSTKFEQYLTDSTIKKPNITSNE
ncbi:hypothetical protein [Flavobacterium sp. H122]|uniref:hypothetical protein n=1 Tax=Flavobacterium sp. H122 TaxID=2529860 RepID=UPI0010AA3456|nr:hypothetical protein [Flavobacterium sp. H122]